MTNFKSIPQELKEVDQWVCWRKQKRDGKAKATKVPVNPSTGKRASTTNPDTWADFRTAVGASEEHRCDGVGFVFTEDDPYIGIDIDHFFRGQAPTTEHAEVFQKVWRRLREFDTYAEFSQSGEGVHLILKGKLPKNGLKNRYNLDGGIGVEVYERGRYFVMTGDRLRYFSAKAVNKQPEALRGLLKFLNGKPGESTKKATRQSQGSLDDDAIIAKAKAAKNGGKFEAVFGGGGADYPSESERDFALAGMLGFWSQDPAQIESIMRQSGCLRDKWDKHPTYLQMTITNAMANSAVFDPDGWTKKTKVKKRDGGEQEIEVTLDERLRMLLTLAHNDLGNADRLVWLFGDIFLWCEAWKAFLVWDNRRWANDTETLEIRRLAEWTMQETQRVYEQFFGKPAGRTDDEFMKWINGQLSRARMDAMLHCVKHKRTVERNKLDADPWLPNCLNGTLDLQTGKLRDHCKEDRITKLVSVEYDPEAKHKVWSRFLRETFPDVELRRFVQMAFGTALTGIFTDEALFILQGDTETGKSTLTDPIYPLLGLDYSATLADISTLKPTGSPGGPRSDVARLEGKRFVNCPETEKNEKLLVSFLKRMTGGDLITARGLFQSEREFRPTWKIFIPTNYAIELPDDTDEAVWRRLIVVPFENRVENPNPDLKKQLREDPECQKAILAWLVQGCRRWQKLGGRLGDHKSAAIVEAIDRYREEIDPTAGFFTDVLDFSERRTWTPTTELKSAYSMWLDSNREARELSDDELYQRLRSRGGEPKSKKQDHVTKRGWVGVQVAY